MRVYIFPSNVLSPFYIHICPRCLVYMFSMPCIYMSSMLRIYTVYVLPALVVVCCWRFGPFVWPHLAYESMKASVKHISQSHLIHKANDLLSLSEHFSPLS